MMTDTWTLIASLGVVPATVVVVFAIVAVIFLGVTRLADTHIFAASILFADRTANGAHIGNST